MTYSEQFDVKLNGSEQTAGLKVLRHRAGSPACGIRLWKKKEEKESLTFKKNNKFRFTSSTTNSIRGTPLSLSTKLTLLANQKFLLL